MKKEDIVAVTVRLFAIVLGIYAISRVPTLAVYLHQNQPGDPSYLILFGISGMLIFGAVFLWKFSFHRAPTALEDAERCFLSDMDYHRCA